MMSKDKNRSFGALSKTRNCLGCSFAGFLDCRTRFWLVVQPHKHTHTNTLPCRRLFRWGDRQKRPGRGGGEARPSGGRKLNKPDIVNGTRDKVALKDCTAFYHSFGFLSVRGGISLSFAFPSSCLPQYADLSSPTWIYIYIYMDTVQ